MLQELVRLTESPKGQQAARAVIVDTASSTAKIPSMTTNSVSTPINCIINEAATSAGTASEMDD